MVIKLHTQKALRLRRSAILFFFFAEVIFTKASTSVLGQPELAKGKTTISPTLTEKGILTFARHFPDCNNCNNHKHLFLMV